MFRKMKDSGIEWIGEIPVAWNVGRVKHGFYRKKEEAHQDNPVILSLARSGVKVRDISNNEGQIAESYYHYNVVSKGDLLLNPMDLYSGANCSISKVSGVISPAYINLGAKEGFHPSYYDYYFKTQYWAMTLFAHGKGVSFDNRWTLSADDLMRYYIPIPPLSEQIRIAEYLDVRCAQIDAVMGKTRTSIEEYKTLKQAIITQAVTKGIQPNRNNRKMKKCQDRWISSIPDNWECKKFKYIATIKSNLVSPDGYADYPQVSPENIEKGTGRLLPCKTVSEVGVISGNHLFFEGQILYSKIRPILNKVAIAPFDGLCSADMYPIETILNKQFFVYALRSDTFLANIGLITEDRVKMPKINQEELTNIYFSVPPEKEQEEIVAYLDDKTREIETLISKKGELLLELESYKKSLVFEYVTGKKEVPA